MATTTVIDKPPRGGLWRVLSTLLALFVIIAIIIMIRSLWDVEDSMKRVATSELTSGQLVIATINDNDKLGRDIMERGINRLDERLDNTARAFGEGLKALSGSIDNTRRDISESIRASRDLTTSKIDSVIIGQDTTTKAVTSGLSELVKQVADLKAATHEEAQARSVSPVPSPQPRQLAKVDSPPLLDNSPPMRTLRPLPTAPIAPETRIENMGEIQRDSVVACYQIRAGMMSKKFPASDIVNDRIRLSVTAGVVMRNYLRGWGTGWIDSSLDASGGYYLSPQASKVSFYSETRDFEIRVYR